MNNEFFINKEYKTIHTMDDKDKGKWVELTEKELQEQMIGLIDYCYDNEYANIDLSQFNYEAYNESYYKEKYDGFPNEVYEILANSTKAPKVVDTREPILQIKHEKTVVKFD